VPDPVGIDWRRFDYSTGSHRAVDRVIYPHAENQITFLMLGGYESMKHSFSLMFLMGLYCFSAGAVEKSPQSGRRPGIKVAPSLYGYTLLGDWAAHAER